MLAVEESAQTFAFQRHFRHHQPYQGLGPQAGLWMQIGILGCSLFSYFAMSNIEQKDFGR
jgi:hypothetical protein